MSVFWGSKSFAQNVAINEDGSAANPNAILDIKSFNKGILIPRLSTAGRLSIPNNANTVFGYNSFIRNTFGGGNVAVGAEALNLSVGGDFNTGIGYRADVTTDFLFNATAIGANTKVNASNKVRIGNSAVTVIEGQVPFTTPSDGRFKYAVKEDVKGLDFIMQLRPVTYQFDVKRFDDQLHNAEANSKLPKTANNDVNSKASEAMEASYNEATAIRRTGFIAQEVEKAANATGYDFSGIIKPKTDQDHYSLSYESFVVPLVKAVQEQQKLIADLQKTSSRIKAASTTFKITLFNQSFI
jgi:trimeric autotransporter adhesin